MKKSQYMDFFVQCKPFLKMKYFCELAEVNPVNLSRFMKGKEWSYELSIESCERLYNVIVSFAQTIA